MANEGAEEASRGGNSRGKRRSSMRQSIGCLEKLAPTHLLPVHSGVQEKKCYCKRVATILNETYTITCITAQSRECECHALSYAIVKHFFTLTGAPTRSLVQPSQSLSRVDIVSVLMYTIHSVHAGLWKFHLEQNLHYYMNYCTVEGM